MLRVKKGGFLVTLLTLAILLLSSSVSFAVAPPNLQGTWHVKLNVRFTNISWAGQPPSEVFDDTATMKITQPIDDPDHYLDFPKIEIDGTTNLLIDEATPNPDFKGRGFVNGGSYPHMIATGCPFEYTQQIVIHKINNNKMKGTWMILGGSEDGYAGIVATFAATRISTDDPGVDACSLSFP
ncbi:MAG TPA: hypothetical protein ACFYD6_06585 [Candidatus Brocadiia bacterium]|nr:hypothetical protein [Candidatus Brocadiales bacterium]